MKYENLALEIKIISKLNNVFNQKHLESTSTKVSYITQIPNDTPLDLKGIG
jgi:hypothetical protein